jgi:tetratricopeptide (TPR) repeat protein
VKKTIIALALLSSVFSVAQNWSVRISSNVELRTWKLSYKAEKKEEPLGGATIVLSKGGTTVSQTTSNGSGDFAVMVPGNGVYILKVSYAGCNTKKFEIITTGVPEEIQKDNFHPSFSIGGFVMAKPFPGIDYSGLQQPLVKVVYEPKIKNFDDDESYTDVGLGIVGKIWDAEQTLINKFCNTNKAGDAALAKPDCPLAKKLYNEAIALIPGEPYPVEQLAKVGDCLKSEEEKKKAAEETAKKAEAEKLAKAEAAKLAKEKALADKKAKEDADKLAKEKAAAEKTAKVNETKKQSPAPSKPAEKKPIEKKEEVITAKMPEAESGEAVAGNGEGDHRIPQVLGANKYKEQLNKAESYFKMKRWTEARSAYKELLKLKPGDPHATNRLAEIEQLSSPK